jgi:hypothetical protein
MRVMLLVTVLACASLAWPQEEDRPQAPAERPPAQPAEPPPAEPRTVKVTAEGYNRDDALKQALRKALEQGAGVQIASHTQTENFALIRDTIYSRAAGLVSDYKVLRESEGPGGTVVLTIEAVVRPSTVAEAWGEVQNVLDQIGRPKIMVWVDEKIDGRPQDESIVESRIEELFLKAGFDLVERKAVEELKRREAGAAADEKSAAKLARLAKDAGAHVLIRGAANADRAGLRDVYGTRAAFYNCSVQAKIYWTDTGKLLVSESIPTRERGVRSYHELNPQAARAALVAATFPDSDERREPTLATKLLDSVMAQWASELTSAGDIQLEIERLEFKAFLNIKKALADLQGIRSVEGDFTKNTGVFRIKAQLSAQTLAELLTSRPFDGWLEVTDLKLNRIQAKATSQPAAP